MINKTSKNFEIVWYHPKEFLKRTHANYLLSHHLEEDIEHLIADTNNALHHACQDKKGNLRKLITQHEEKNGQR